MAHTLEDAITSIEHRLAALGVALRDRDPQAIDAQSQGLNSALAGAIQRFSQASKQAGGVPPQLRRRLALAGGQVAAQRESLARATAALDRAIDVLIPPAAQPAAYGARGGRDRPSHADAVNA